MKRFRIKKIFLIEAVVIVFCLAASFHFLEIRINYTKLPSGDEGSWMAVAAELSKGNGFTTRWLQYHMLEPYKLPRPDDFRFPVLVTALALGFKLFGISYQTALWDVGGIFLLFILLLYLSVRNFYGVPTACATTLITSFSTLQLHWNSEVYTEGLFGVFVALLILWTGTFSVRRPTWWIGAGAGVALLYLIRPNGLLLIVGLFWCYFRFRKEITYRYLILSLIVLFGLISPWLIRNFVHFGNPLHFAGSAGLLRGVPSDPDNWSVFEYLGQYGIFFPFKRIVIGLVRFWHPLHFYEHGLQVVPLILVVAGLGFRRKFYNPFLACGFLITFLACCYTSFTSWGAVRYISGFLPFIYAFGIKSCFDLAEKVSKNKWRRIRIPLYIAVPCLILSTVFYPHRFYERKYSGIPQVNKSDLSAYAEKVKEYVKEDQTYMALHLGQINFLTDRNCVGLQTVNGYDWMDRAIKTFEPKLLVFTPKEVQSSQGREIIKKLDTLGISLQELDTDNIAHYFLLKPES